MLLYVEVATLVHAEDAYRTIRDMQLGTVPLPLWIVLNADQITIKSIVHNQNLLDCMKPPNTGGAGYL